MNEFNPGGPLAAGYPMLQTSGDLLADRRFAWGQSLAAEGDHAAAADLFAPTVERAPHWTPGWFALGEARRCAEDEAGAVAAFTEAARLGPADRLGASLALAALSAGPAPEAAPAAYVERLFDDYAERFDAHLTGALHYRGPALLRAVTNACVPPPARFARVMDLGCGTGLMGEAIRDRADWLGGVDLSAAMVAQAENKTLYDHLAVGDLHAVLDGTHPFDLVLAADVLVYLGDLRPAFRAVRAALTRGGLFAFTVQRAPDGVGVAVGADLRFSHSADHVREAAREAGFFVQRLEEASTRRDGGQNVLGLVAMLRME